MGYTSLLEDITNKFLEVQLLVKSQAGSKATKIINGPIEISKTNKHINRVKNEKSTIVSEIEELKRSNKKLFQENAMLQSELKQKEKFLLKLQDRITRILEEHNKSMLAMEHEHQISIRKVTGEKAEVELDYKSAILRIGSIIQQPNFHKKQDNINNITLIIKKMTGL